jgi:hypothetical protein
MNTPNFKANSQAGHSHSITNDPRPRTSAAAPGTSSCLSLIALFLALLFCLAPSLSAQSCSVNLGTGRAPGVVNTASDPVWKIFDEKKDITVGPAVLIGTPTWGAPPSGLHWIATQPGFSSGGNQYTAGDYIFYATFKGSQGVLNFRVKADNAVDVSLNNIPLLTWGNKKNENDHSGWTNFSPVQTVATGFLATNTLILRVHNLDSSGYGSYMGVLLDGQFNCTCGNPSLVQSNYGKQGNFEVVAPYPSGGIAHYWRDNDHNGVWYAPTAIFGPSGQVDAVSMIESSFGNLEVVARAGDQLSHYYRDYLGAWHGTGVFAYGASGVPSFIQSDNGNFELVTPLATGGMAHYYRDSSWHGTVVFGTGTQVDAVSLIQSSFGGNLEVVARIGSQLAHFYRDYQGNWNETTLFASGVSGAPSLIQGPFGSPGNFEVVTPLATGGMAHYWRDNSNPSQPWYGPTLFGSGDVGGASLIHSNYGNNFEVVDSVGCTTLQHYYRDYQNTWDGPTTIP